MNRREFFSTTAAGVGALAATRFGWAAQTVDPKVDWKKVRQSTLDRIAIMTLNFQSILKVPDTQDSPNRTLELSDIGEMLADTYGVHKVEFQHYHLASVEPSYFKDMRGKLEKSKSRATQINLEFSGLNISAPQQRDRLLAIDLTKMWVDHAVALGAQRVMINQGQPTHENKVHSIPTLKAMVDYGKSKNIIVSVETRGGGGGGGRGRGGQGGQGQAAPGSRTSHDGTGDSARCRACRWRAGSERRGWSARTTGGSATADGTCGLDAARRDHQGGGFVLQRGRRRRQRRQPGGAPFLPEGDVPDDRQHHAYPRQHALGSRHGDAISRGGARLQGPVHDRGEQRPRGHARDLRRRHRYAGCEDVKGAPTFPSLNRHSHASGANTR